MGVNLLRDTVEALPDDAPAILPFFPQVIPHRLCDFPRCQQPRDPRFFAVNRFQLRFEPRAFRGT